MSILYLIISLILGFIVGRYTRGWGMSEKEKKVWRDVGRYVKLVESTQIISPSKKASIRKEIDKMTNN